MMSKDILICPCCESELKYRQWSEEGYIVETNYICPSCKYKSIWAYGHDSEEIPEGYDENYEKVVDDDE